MNDQIKVYEDLRISIENATSALENLLSYANNISNISVSNLAEEFEIIALTIVESVKSQTDAEKASKFLTETFSLLSNALSVANIAFGVFNETLKINPIIFTISLVASLATSLIGLTSATNVQTEAEISLAEAAKKAAEEHQKLIEKGNEAAIGINSEMDYYQQLKRELDTLVDSNGKVIKGNEERANFITQTLSKVMGKELKITDDMIENYESMSISIEKLIEKKRAEALLSAHEGEYQNALKNRATALKSLTEATNALNAEEQKKTTLLIKLWNQMKDTL